MVATPCEQFQERLRTSGCYETPPDRKRSLADRCLGRLDAWYYLRMTAITLRARRKALRGLYDSPAWAASSFETYGLVEDCGGMISVAGACRPARIGGPAVYIANHMSLLETFLLPCLLLSFNPVGIVTVVKKSLLDYPAFGAVLRATRPISVGRDNARADLAEVLEKGLQGLQEGRSALVFPQSTRKTIIHENDFNSIGVKLARRAGVPAVPVALKTDFQGIGGWLRDFGSIHRSRKVRFEFGEPVSVQGNGRAEHEQIVKYIVDTVTAWQTQEPE